MERHMGLSDVFFPSNIRCIFCGTELDNEVGICATCNSRLPYIMGNRCTKCGGEVVSEDYCIDCSREVRLFVRNYSVFNYKGEVKDMLRAFKSGKPYLGKPFAHILYDYYRRLDTHFDVVIPIPIHKSREKERGFNQAEILASEIERNTGLVRNDIVVKAVDTPHQTGLSRENRLTNIIGSFEVVDKTAVKGKTILVVDDIYTTGSTINEVARILLEAGATAVYGLCLARGKTIDY